MVVEKYRLTAFFIFMSASITSAQNKTQIPQTPTTYSFHYFTVDQCQQTIPVEGGKGQALYNVDNTGAYEEGEIELNIGKKYFIVRATGDRQASQKAIIDGMPEYDKFWDSYAYPAHWEQNKEKTKIIVAYNNSMRMITLNVDFSHGKYTDYWDKVYHYHVELKK